ncbi:hypothetical protein [Alteromonas sp. a30]|uniref:hypothetical protein n=1 Tax=Alteromonas sp. a30 TaxID=2730917 RepID=UPI0022803EE0|nr:hypothetical protein [Alteromonas sp. a30]MCY7296767.1 hypothetical protein [Alteromonas sp. a30]
MKAQFVLGFFVTAALFGCNEQSEQTLASSITSVPEAQTALYPEGHIPATAYLQHDEVYNPESVIPPQCYTKTDGVNNPCFACHQSYPRSAGRSNMMSDADLQGDYQFSDEGMTNSWKNLFIDRSKMIQSISDAEMQAYIREDNYTPLLAKLEKHKQWKGNYVALNGLAFPQTAFDENGLAKDGSHWVSYNYKPFPSTFWPTNGSTDDSMIRLPKAFREHAGKYSFDVYFANLALVEMAIKDVSRISVPAISEVIIGRDLNANGELETAVSEIVRQNTYVGDANNIELKHMLYPQETEFLHTVRYIGVDENGDIYNAPRLKELRYMKKHQDTSLATLRVSYMQEYKEKDAETLPKTVYLGERGIDNGFGWTINGYIEDAQGELRQQEHQELAFCNGCHKTVGSTIDQIFSFARKVEGEQGWGYINLREMRDVPNIVGEKGEFLTYFERVGGGDEFRQNQEMLDKWFNHDGSVNVEKVAQAETVYDLIAPSARRALDLNKAYWTIVKEQSFIFGRDATISKAKNVLSKIDDSQAPLKENHRYKWDLRLNWHDKPQQRAGSR